MAVSRAAASRIAITRISVGIRSRYAIPLPTEVSLKTLPRAVAMAICAEGSMGSDAVVGFRRISSTEGAGDHIVNCSGTFNLNLDQAQNSKVVPLPFAISTTVSIPDSQTQVIIDLPDPVISLADAARLLGRGYFYAQAGIPGWQEKDMVLDTDCSTNEFEAGVSDGQEEIQAMMQKKGQVIQSGNSDMADACRGSQEDCRQAQRDQRDAIDKASDRVDQAQAQFRSALKDRNRFVAGLDNGDIRVYPSSIKMCGSGRMVTFRFENQFFLAPPNFVIKSGEGGSFRIK